MNSSMSLKIIKDNIKIGFTYLPLLITMSSLIKTHGRAMYACTRQCISSCVFLTLAVCQIVSQDIVTEACTAVSCNSRATEQTQITAVAIIRATGICSCLRINFTILITDTILTHYQVHLLSYISPQDINMCLLMVGA